MASAVYDAGLPQKVISVKTHTTFWKVGSTFKYIAGAPLPVQGLCPLTTVVALPHLPLETDLTSYRQSQMPEHRATSSHLEFVLQLTMLAHAPAVS